MISAALDTSNDFVLAIRHDNEDIFENHLEGIGRDSDTLLADWLIAAFNSCGLTINDAQYWSVGIGPGSFAGLRCGIAMVKAICLNSGAKYRGVPSVYAMARQAQETNGPALIGVLNDGRCGQVILSKYDCRNGMPKLLGDSCPLFPEELLTDEFFCNHYITNQTTIPKLPDNIQEKLIVTPHIQAKYLLDDIPSIPWPQNAVEREKSTAPLYVRQAVFAVPATLRKINE